MVNQSLRLTPIRPLANAIRRSAGPPLPGLIAEALDQIDLNQSAIRVAINVLQTEEAAATTTVPEELLLTPDTIVITTGAQTIANTSAVPTIVYGERKVLILRIQQAPTPGGGIIAFDSADFWPGVPQEISPDPDTLTVYMFVGLGGKWLFLNVANPI